MDKLNGAVKAPRPMAAPEIDIDQLESTVEQWDSTIRKAQILGQEVAVDPAMLNLVNAGREYARLRRESDDGASDG